MLWAAALRSRAQGGIISTHLLLDETVCFLAVTPCEKASRAKPYFAPASVCDRGECTPHFDHRHCHSDQPAKV
jgi:hypothetical protein